MPGERANRPPYLGIDVGLLLSHARVCRKVVRENPDAPRDRWKELIRFRKIRLRAEHLLGDEPELTR